MSIAVPDHWKVADIFVMREDRIRIFQLAIGWDYFHFTLGCYWFALDIGWMAPLYNAGWAARLGAYYRLAWNVKRRKLSWGSIAWERSTYHYVVQKEMYA